MKIERRMFGVVPETKKLFFQPAITKKVPDFSSEYIKLSDSKG
jgi:hypothetical protein